MEVKKKILLIEDDVFLAEVLIHKLNSSGFDVLVSGNGKEGYEQIKSQKPDLILLDIILPEMNGYQILEAKLNDPTIKDIPVIIVSNSGQPVEIKRAMSLGVKSYLIKADIDPDEAVNKVKEILSNNGQKVATSVSSSSQGSLTGKKLLWVEDDRFLKDIITVRLANEGCLLMHAGDESEAFSILEREKPDVILLDILLPGTDGFEILKKLKTTESTKNVPVIMLSNLSQQADIERGRNGGAVKFLVKSTVTLDEIIAEIREVLMGTGH